MSDGYPDEKKNGAVSKFFKRLSRKMRNDEDITGEELIDMVNESSELGVINENEAEMINNIVEFGEKQAEDVMTHRKDIVAIDVSASVEEAFKIIMESVYSRYPVIDGDLDNIVGTLHIRDLFKIYMDEENRHSEISKLKHQILFDPFFVPETRKISSLFKQMQENKLHMSVVVDEYGQTTGIITLEDILEEIVGNIQDEYDKDEELLKREEDGTYLISGKCGLEELEEILNISFDCEDIDTINGYMIYKMGKIPDEGDRFEVQCGEYVFSIEEINGKMIDLVRVRKSVNNFTI